MKDATTLRREIAELEECLRELGSWDSAWMLGDTYEALSHLRAQLHDTEQAARIVDQITRDLTGRSGMDWDIDDETRNEIRDTWIGIVRAELGR